MCYINMDTVVQFCLMFGLRIQEVAVLRKDDLRILAR